MKRVMIPLFVVSALTWLTPTQAFSWKALWQSPDQQALNVLQQGKPSEAAHLFHTPLWQGVAQFKAQHYDAAESLFAQQHSALAHYNRGNALAYQGKYQEAITAYNQALALNKDFIDAKFNRNLLQKYLHDQQQKKQQNKPENKDNKQQDKQNKNQSEDKNENQNNEQNNDQDQQKKSSNKSNKNNQPKQPDQSQQLEQPQQASDKKQQSKQNSQSNLSLSDQEQKQAQDQWLRRIPDTPPGLLRQKFLRDYQRRQQEHRL